MNRPRSSPKPRPVPRLGTGFVVFFVGVTAALVVLPALLLHVSSPETPSPTTQPAKRHTRDTTRRPRESRNATSAPAVASDQSQASDDEATPASTNSPTSKPEDTPIIERRWTGGGTSLPSGAPPADAADVAARDRDTHDDNDEYDRSTEARRRRVQEYGGNEQTEDAVEIGLQWLAAHQSPDGSWSRTAFSQQCPRNDRCPGAAVRRMDSSLQAGLTGLSLLAFLGAGYTDSAGPHQDTVARAVAALLNMQQADGGFGGEDDMAGYDDSLATFALAETYALTLNPRLVEPLERAVQRILLSQQRLGGWDYLPRNDSGRNDTSITAWMVQALRAAAAAGIQVPPRALVRSALHFSRAIAEDGSVWYADAGTGFSISPNAGSPVYRYGPAMTAAGLTCEYLLGWRGASDMAHRQQALLLSQLPSVSAMQYDDTGLHSYYYWYYGTVAMFQTGGDAWERWNAALRDSILPLQDRTKTATGVRRHSYGSWPPFGVRWGRWGRMGGRVYATALNVLTLETYYRHLPAYLAESPPMSAADWRMVLHTADARQVRWATAALRASRFEIAEPVLIDLLDHHERSAALTAAAALASMGSPIGRRVFEAIDPPLETWEQREYASALRAIDALEKLPPARGTVRVYDAEHRLATLDLPRSYVGMRINVLRDGKVVARMRVIQRFTGRDVAVAELLSAADAPPRAGDSVVSE